MLAWRSSKEVGMAVSCHLGGRLLVHIMVVMGTWHMGNDPQIWVPFARGRPTLMARRRCVNFT
jgi:hypothetical protein